GGGAFPAVRSMAGGSRQERAQRSKRGRAGDGGRRRPAECSHGPAQGFRRSRFRLLHKFRERQGPRDSRRDEGGHVLPLEVATPPGARPRPGRGRQRRGGGRLLRKQAKRKPHWRLGVQTIAPPGKPVCAGKGGGGIYGTLCGGQYSTPFLLVGLSHIAAVNRVLARSTVPLARPRHVQPSRKRGMGENKALPLRLGLSRHLERPRATDQPAFLRFMKAMNAARASLDFRRWRNSSLSCWIRSSRGSRGPRIRSRVTLSASGGFCATASAAASTVASSSPSSTTAWISPAAMACSAEKPSPSARSEKAF